MKSIGVKVRGIVREKGDRLELRAKSSAQVFRLAITDDKTDVIGPLKEDLTPPAKTDLMDQASAMRQRSCGAMQHRRAYSRGTRRFAATRAGS